MVLCRKSRLTRLLFALSALTLLWLFVGEYGVWYLYSLQWYWPQVHDGAPIASSLRILLLSDPHIQCSFDRYEPWLFRWDSDSYVSKVFSFLVSTLSPHVIVVLGDIFAEGYKASPQQWKDYLQCMRDLFPVAEGVGFLVVPGDNDIGGEGSDGMMEEVNRRYRAEFGEFNQVVHYKEATFIKLNSVSLLQHAPQPSSEEGRVRHELEQFLANASTTLPHPPDGAPHTVPRILLMHVPFADVVELRQQLLAFIAPDFVFSGHTHHEATTWHEWPPVRGAATRGGALEHTVPTCSYRMGEVHMGAGAATVEDGEMSYRVLWLPQRYPFLASYCLFGAAIVSLIFLITARTRRQTYFSSCPVMFPS